MATIVAMPFVGRGMVQKYSILKKKGSQIRKVGISESRIIGINFPIFLSILRNDTTFSFLFTTNLSPNRSEQSIYARLSIGMQRVKEISVFFPVYNEEANLESTVKKARDILLKIADIWEIIIINDGSKDDSLIIANDLINFDKRIKVINHEVNKGYGEALKSGFYSAKYPLIATIDADGQFDFSEVTKLLEKIDKADMVIGYRLDRKDSLIRKIFGWGWTLLANVMLGIMVKDVDCSFKLVKKEVIDRIPKLQSSRGGMISPELLAKAKKYGFKIDQVGVHHFERRKGHQTGADMKVIMKSFSDLFSLWFQLR